MSVYCRHCGDSRCADGEPYAMCGEVVSAALSAHAEEVARLRKALEEIRQEALVAEEAGDFLKWASERARAALGGGA